MATTTYATHSAVPSEFMDWVKNFLAQKLSADRTDVRLATDESEKTKVHWAADRLVLLTLGDPVPQEKDPGGGRHAYIVVRPLEVKVKTRGGEDVAGSDEIALANHWDFQDVIFEALVLELGNAEKRFVNPIKYVGAKGRVERVKDTVSVFESTLVFEVKYVLKVTR
jgi:hypothetical protein